MDEELRQMIDNQRRVDNNKHAARIAVLVSLLPVYRLALEAQDGGTEVIAAAIDAALAVDTPSTGRDIRRITLFAMAVGEITGQPWDDFIDVFADELDGSLYPMLALSMI